MGGFFEIPMTSLESGGSRASRIMVMAAIQTTFIGQGPGWVHLAHGPCLEFRLQAVRAKIRDWPRKRGTPNTYNCFVKDSVQMRWPDFAVPI